VRPNHQRIFNPSQQKGQALAADFAIRRYGTLLRVNKNAMN
jgi:hypothetical protein